MKNIYVQTKDGPKPVAIPWKLILGIIIVLVLMVVGGSSFYTIEANEKGVVQRFGQYIGETNPGLHFKLPWGIDKVTPVLVDYVYKDEFGFRTETADVRTSYKRRQASYDEEARMLTGDLNIAIVEWSVQYTVKDASKFLFNVRNPQRTLRDMSESIMREVVGDRAVTEALTEGRKEITMEVQNKLQEVLDTYESGIRISQVMLKGVSPPDEVKRSFNEVNEAQQEMDETVNQAKEAYEKVIPRAKGEAQKTVDEAKGYKEERVNMATGNVARFKSLLEEYLKAPEITRLRIYIETMEEVLPLINRKIIIDEDAKSILPLLDLNGKGGSK